MRIDIQAVHVMCKSMAQRFCEEWELKYSSPAHSYTYPFEGNPEWSHFYASSTQILQYFKDFADKHDLYKYVRLRSRILSVIWDADKGICNSLLTKAGSDADFHKDNVQVESQGVVTHDWCHVFINGGGYLNSWKCERLKPLPVCLHADCYLGPNIQGLHEFEGKLVHSAAWDKGVNTCEGLEEQANVSQKSIGTIRSLQ